MPAGLIFWMLMILWAVFGVGYPYFVASPNPHVVRGGSLLLFVLLALLGWQVFGAAVK